MAILRMPAVKVEMGYRSHASIYNDIRDGVFTKPVKLSERSVGWPDYEVKALVAAKIAGATKEQARELVSRLHAKRTDSVGV